MLQVLDLSSNNLTEWPLPQSTLPSLRQLNISTNGRLMSVPQIPLQCCVGSLQSLDLSGASPRTGAVS